VQIQGITYNLDRLALYAVIGMGIVAICASVVAIVAFRKDGNASGEAFVKIANHGGALKLLTVGLVVFTATFLTLADKIRGEAVVAIISGVAGYVLGGVERDKGKTPKSPSHPPTS
jgi:hypothetical protein